MTDIDLKREGENAVLRRLLLWTEKEARIAGVDIEQEMTSIMAKFRAKTKPPIDPARR